ncbi:MAG TPA: hypothetical protein VEW74_09205 [Candidatus Nitrosotalea sp.]|nr:hypothetical protein [Candidatus Nitrosotalea sp.]
MRISRSAAYAISALAAAALLAACNGSGGSQSYAPSGSGVTSPMAHQPFMPDHKYPGFTGSHAPVSHPAHGKTWISPDVKKAPRIMFVSDYGSNVVYMYAMPDVTLKGTLYGFSGPQGMCTDGSNIYIANTNTSQILKYSRTGTLLNTLSDSGEYPTGCSFNRATGDLVVSNIINTSGGPGNLELYHGATGTPTPLTNSNQYEYFFPTYDNAGNIYVDGFSNSFTFLLSECPSGSSTCHNVSVSGASPFFPGGLNWNRVTSQLVVGDQECGGTLGSCWYAGTVSGSTYTVSGTTNLANTDGTGCDVDQGALGPFGKYAGGGCIGFYSPSVSARWAYPAGGDPNWYNSSVVEPIGAAISNK